MCTMLPMRSVPHRVICLLGVDDATFPRHRLTDGDDIVALDPWIGDRDPRSEDRQLLLDAVLAATERLIVVYSGIDARTGASKPVAVPVGELLDALEETARTGDERTVRERITTRHPLQPFDRGNFVAGPEQRPLSFDRASLLGATAALRERQAPPDPFAPTDLPSRPPAAEVALADLVRFFAHPARALLRSQAQLRLVDDEDETPAEQIPIAPDGLESWSIGNRLLQRHLAGIPVPQLAGAEWRRGLVPPGVLGAQTLRPIGRQVEEIANAAAEQLREPAVGHDIDVRLDGVGPNRLSLDGLGPGLRALTGTIPAVHGDRIVAVVYSWLAAKHRLQSWIELLALTASEPADWRAVTIGRGGTLMLGPVAPGVARDLLTDLVMLYDAGQHEPLPFAPKTSAAYARIRREDRSVVALGAIIQREWTGNGRFGGERDADYARFDAVYPAALDGLLASRARAVDVRDPYGEPSRFGSIARRVWQPLLDHEEPA
jgi:exodeoxyribonuclease V gamma subunit